MRLTKNKWRGEKREYWGVIFFCRLKNKRVHTIDEKKKKNTFSLSLTAPSQADVSVWISFRFWDITNTVEENRTWFAVSQQKKLIIIIKNTLKRLLFSGSAILSLCLWEWKLTLRDKSVKRYLAPWSQSVAQAYIENLTTLSEIAVRWIANH